MLPIQISPSVMCMDLWSDPLGTLRLLEAQRVDYLHIDIMDGHFTPNITLGTDFVRTLRKKTVLPLDIHLMVDHPGTVLEWLDIAPGEIVSVHAEGHPHLQRVLARIRTLGGRPFVALNPATPLVMLEEVLADADGVLVMTVNPGFAGQRLIPGTLDKTRRLRRWLDDRGYGATRIQADGNVSFEHAPAMRRAGVDIFVGGSSSVFDGGGSVDDNIRRLRTLLAAEG